MKSEFDKLLNEQLILAGVKKRSRFELTESLDDDYEEISQKVFKFAKNNGINDTSSSSNDTTFFVGDVVGGHGEYIGDQIISISWGDDDDELQEYGPAGTYYLSICQDPDEGLDPDSANVITFDDSSAIENGIACWMAAYKYLQEYVSNPKKFFKKYKK